MARPSGRIQISRYRLGLNTGATYSTQPRGPEPLAPSLFGPVFDFALRPCPLHRLSPSQLVLLSTIDSPLIIPHNKQALARSASARTPEPRRASPRFIQGSPKHKERGPQASQGPHNPRRKPRFTGSLRPTRVSRPDPSPGPQDKP